MSACCRHLARFLGHPVPAASLASCGVSQPGLHHSESGEVCRFVLNVLERDDLQEEEQPESSAAVQEDRSTAGLGLGSSFPGLQMDDRVQVLPEGTVEAEADADIKVRQPPCAA